MTSYQYELLERAVAALEQIAKNTTPQAVPSTPATPIDYGRLASLPSPRCTLCGPFGCTGKCTGMGQ